MKTIALAVVVLAAVVIGLPLAVIWALNSLFVLGIDYSIGNWLAALLLTALVAGRSK